MAGGTRALPAVHDTGSGPAILFLHAFPLDASQWDHQVAALSGRFRCVRVDVWGCGASPPAPDATGLSQFAGSVVEALDQRGIERFAACGLSMGGYVLWELLRLVPQRLTHVALCSTRAAADTPEGRRTRTALAARVRDAGVESIVEENVVRLLSTHAQNEVHVADPVRARIRRCTPEGVAWASLAMGARPDSTGLLPEIRVPSLVVAGAQDVVMPSADQRSMAERMRGAEFAAFDGCGHLVNLEEPEAFSERLEAFLIG